MTMTLAQLARAVDEFAPTDLAYDWDNVGLQIGDPAAEVHRALVALEVTEQTIQAAIDEECQAIIAHHPLIFRPLKSLRPDTPVGRLQFDLIRSGIGLIAAHTNLDRVLHGTNGAVAELLGLRDCEVLDPVSVTRQYKFTVFVPQEYTDKIVDAIHRGGGGRIGAYSHCSFRSPGTGTFIPMEGARPFSGSIGKMERAEEDRLEALVPEKALRDVLAEVRQAHPYEEVAFDVFPLHEADPEYGLGLVGTLPTKTPLRQFAQQVRQAVDEDYAQFAGESKWPVKRVAVITGSAGSSAYGVSKKLADVLITGELNYHTVLDVTARGVGVVTVGHAASERVFAPHFCRVFPQQKSVADAQLELVPFTDFPEPWKLVRPADNGSRRGKKS